MGSYSSEDPSYKIHAIEYDGDCAESWADGIDTGTQPMLPVQEVVESKMRMISYPPLLTKPDEADDYKSSLLPVQPILAIPLLLEELEADIDLQPTPLPESTGKFKFVKVIETFFFFEH